MASAPVPAGLRTGQTHTWTLAEVADDVLQNLAGLVDGGPALPSPGDLPEAALVMALAATFVLASFVAGLVGLVLLWKLTKHRLPGRRIRFGSMKWISDSFDRSGYDERGQRLLPKYVAANVVSMACILTYMILALAAG